MMGTTFRIVPYLQIWLSPVCEICVDEAEVLWCKDCVFEPCEKCGRKPLRYFLDRRQRQSRRVPKGATPQ